MNNMKLREMPKPDIVALAQPNQVDSYMTWFATDGSIVAWKVRLKNNREEVLILAPAVAVHFTHSAEKAMIRHGWSPSSDWPDDPPVITDAEIDEQKNKFGQMTECRIESFNDLLVVALYQTSETLTHSARA
jgi:hypothetical protein